MKWTASDIPDQSGKITIITGGNSGLGFHAVRELAKKKAKVVMAVRNREKGLESKQKLLAELPGAEIIVMKLDLSNIESIKQFSYTFLEEFDRLDILINNAGIMAIPLMRTIQGFEMQFGTNHLGHFALTALLIDVINKTPGARIVNVSSIAYKMGQINFDDLNSERSYSKWKAYGQSKLANLLFTIELDRRLKISGKSTLVASSHPGYTATNLQIKGPELEGAKLKKAMMHFSNRLFGQDPGMGVLPILYAAIFPSIKPAGFYGPGGVFHMRGYPVEEKIDRKRVNPTEAPGLWEESEKLTGIPFLIK